MGFIMKDFLKNIAVFVIFAILMAFAVEWILRLLPDAADSRYHSIFAYREKSGGYYTLVPGKTAKVNGVLYSVNPEAHNSANPTRSAPTIHAAVEATQLGHRRPWRCIRAVHRQLLRAALRTYFCTMAFRFELVTGVDNPDNGTGQV